MKLNGNLVLNALGQSEIQNLTIERVAAVPSFNAADKGRIVHNLADDLIYTNNGTAWVTLATGGNAAALQTELDLVESALGTFVDASGNFVGSALDAMTNVTGSTSLLNALTQLDSAISGSNALAEMVDVNLVTLSDNQFLQYNNSTSQWDNVTFVQSMVSDVSTTAAELNEINLSGAVAADYVKLAAITSSAIELNILDGALLSTAELNFVDGVTSNIQVQLDARQPLDTQLTSIAGLTPAQDDFLVGDAVAGNWSLESGAAARTSMGVAIGVDVEAYDAGLSSIAALTTAADTMIYTTALDVYATTALTAAGRALMDDATDADQRTTLGLVAGGSGDIWVEKAGDVMTGALTLSGAPTLDNHATNKAYVDALVAAGASWKNPVVDSDLVDVISANVVDPETDYGLSPGDNVCFIVTGAGFTAQLGSGTPLSVVAGNIIDLTITSAGNGDYSLVETPLTAGDRFIISAEHGTIGTGLSSLDVNSDTFNLANGDLIQFTGTGNGSTAASWSTPDGRSGAAGGGVEIAQGVTVLNADPDSVHYGHTYLYDQISNAWVEIAGPGSIGAGNGLVYVGNTLNVNMGAGVVQLPTDEVGIDLYDSVAGALVLTVDGSTRGTSTADKLHLLLDTSGNGQLVQSASGLKVTTNTITENELTASVAGAGLTGGVGVPLAVVSNAGSAGSLGTVTVSANDIGVDLGSTSTTAAPGNHVHSAAVVTFNNTTSALTATDVQAAIDEIDGRIDTAETNVTNTQTEIDAIETGAGLETNGAYIAPVGTNYLGGASSLKDADSTLDTTIKALSDRVDKGYFVYTGASATSHVINHAIGSQYCNVTVIDSGTNEQVIPNKVTFTDTANLTVEFNSALACKVVIMGLGV